ncbi:hypothetical protein C8Q76DRAFT_797985 [Earliella scabrosa]|nr:hypothetical protein C8Q76DRAFT_797985 [Earliella scabrosa]
MAVGSREWKRGNTTIGLVGTLNDARNEDKESNAGEAMQCVSLALWTCQGCRRGKEDRTIANRKEEDLRLKDSITLMLVHSTIYTTAPDPLTHQHRPIRLHTPLASPRSHPPPLYYLPMKLLPS